jgi:hypothetical protein
MVRYYSRMQEHLNASRTPESFSKGDLVYAPKPDAKRGKFSHTWKIPYMIVGSHSGNNNHTLQAFIDQKVQQTIRDINDLRPFLDTDDSDKIDTSDVLPFPQLLPYLILTSGGDTTTARKPAAVEDRSARRTKEDENTSYRVKHFEKLLMQTDSG